MDSWFSMQQISNFFCKFYPEIYHQFMLIKELVIEDDKHYFFTCNQYRNELLIFFEAVKDFQSLSIKLALFRKDTLNNASNTTIFGAVHEYIKKTKIFDTE